MTDTHVTWDKKHILPLISSLFFPSCTLPSRVCRYFCMRRTQINKRKFKQNNCICEDSILEFKSSTCRAHWILVERQPSIRNQPAEPAIAALLVASSAAVAAGSSFFRRLARSAEGGRSAETGFHAATRRTWDRNGIYYGNTCARAHTHTCTNTRTHTHTYA